MVIAFFAIAKKGEHMTKSQNDLSYEIKLALIRAIVNTDNELIWEIVKEAIEKGEEE